MFSRRLTSLLIAIGVGGALTAVAAAKPWDDDDGANRGNRKLQARPFVFVGTVQNCGVQGTDAVTSAWLPGMGLADDGVTTTPPPPGSRRDPHTGLLLNKNAPTSDCSAAGAIIEGFRPGTPVSELGFDYRVGGHCSGGAPRFNVTTTAGFLYFIGGCGNAAPTPAPQYPTEWNRVRFNTAAVVFPQDPTNPPFVFGVTPVRSITILFDEGPDQGSVSDPTGVGLAVLDNIDINGTLITSGKGIAPKNDGKLRNGREEAED